MFPKLLELDEEIQSRLSKNNFMLLDTKNSEEIFVLGRPYADMPEDLYIPPNALKVFLEAFSGPLDLLLYLIKKENIDILDIPIAKITAQYVEYIELMQQMQLELAAEYLVMAAMLAEIKSRLLLPRPAEVLQEEEDPRAELVRRLREYERFKKAGEDLDFLPRIERDIFTTDIILPEIKHERQLPKILLQDLLTALNNILQRAAMHNQHLVKMESLSVRERMTQVLDKLRLNNFVNFSDLFKVEEGKLGVVVTFIAILELLKQSIVDIVQTEDFGEIHIKYVNS